MRKIKEKRDLVVHYGIESYKDTNPTYVTMGMFDGVHIGHQALIKHVVNASHEAGLQNVVISFWPHPKKVLNKDAKIQLLTTIDEKISKLETLGVDHLLLLNFDAELAKKSAEQFAMEYFKGILNAQRVILGYNHRFGSDHLSSEECVNTVKRLSIDTEVFYRCWAGDGLDVSSSEVRKALTVGDVGKASLILGREYSLSGKVEHGMKLGRELGYPTANISDIGEDKMLPNNGVYAVKVDLVEKRNIKTFNGVLNIGIKPTIGKCEKTIEVFLLNFSGDLYNRSLSIRFVAKLRDEFRFDSLDLLKKQIATDVDGAIQLLCK